MKFCLAPLEGITGFAYRNVVHSQFSGIDTFYAPFIQPKQTHVFASKELKDVDPANNQGITLIPQIMANKSAEFIWAASELQKLGYHTINLNLGCPMPTIVTKHKGSGMLENLDSLAVFLDEIFSDAQKCGYQISIKTRLGIENCEQAQDLMLLYNQFPIKLLIIHPRCQKDLYKNKTNPEAFKACLEITKHPVCYNGDIFTKEDLAQWIPFFQQHPQIESVMLARGMIANPALCREIKGGKPASKDELKRYEQALFDAYMAQNIGLSAVLHRMKELWFYLGSMFRNDEKLVHKIRISKTIEEYQPRVRALFENAQLVGHF